MGRTSILESALMVLAMAGSAPAVAADAQLFPQPCPADLAGDRRIRCSSLVLATDGPERTGDGPANSLFHMVLEGGPGIPVVIIPGGPGVSTSGLAAHWRERAQRWRLSRSVVLVDLHGTGLSRPSLDCVELKGQAGLSVDHVAACRERLDAEGAAPGQLGSRRIAADLRRLREALGYRQWIVFGLSHGTRIALLAAVEDGQGVARVVLDSLQPPWRPFYGAELARARDAALWRLVADCRADPVCLDAYPDLGAAVKALPQASAAIQTAVLSLMSRPGTRGLAPYVAELARDPSNPEAIAAVARLHTPRGVAIGHHLALTCREDIPASPQWTGLTAQLKAYVTACAAWGTRPEAGSVVPLPGDIPVLVLAGGLDAVTPLDAEDLERHLPMAVRLTVPDAGHDVLATSACANDVLYRFMADGIPPEPTACSGHAAKSPAFLPPDRAHSQLLELVAKLEP